MKLFLGHPKSQEVPEAVLEEEQQHGRGCWVSLVYCTLKYQTGWFVAYRKSRKETHVRVFEPSIKYGGDGLYLDKWDDCHGFVDDEETARKFFEYLMARTQEPRLPLKVKTTRVQDSQRQKVYDWERHFYQLGTQMTQHEVGAFVRQIESDFRSVNKNLIRLSFREKGGCYQRGYNEINMAKYGWNRDVVIHEMAHWVNTSINYRDKVAGHGPEFMGIFMLMLAHYQGYCLTDMINQAIKDGVKFIFPAGGLATLMVQPKALVAQQERMAA